MKSNKKIVLLFTLTILVVCGLLLWTKYSPTAAEYRWRAYARETELDLAAAFATALRTNHPAAYDWIDPNLKPRLDEWMNTHQSKECTREPDVFLVKQDKNGDYDTNFGCFRSNGPIRMEIDNIVIEDMKVVDWGEVREED